MKVVKANATNLTPGEGTSQGNVVNFYMLEFFDDVDVDIKKFLGYDENKNDV